MNNCPLCHSCHGNRCKTCNLIDPILKKAINAGQNFNWCRKMLIIESVDSISRDERGFPLMQYITNGGISRARYTITHFKHHHSVLRLISNRMNV